MISYKEYNNTQDSLNELAFALIIVEDLVNEMNENELNEADIKGVVNNWLSKLGLEVKQTDGIIQQVKRFTSTAGKLLLAGIKKDKEEIKKISSEIDKSQFIKFLLNLDMITLHLLTGPIHLIAAITGWELEVKGKKAPEVVNYVKMFYKSLDNVKNSIKNLVKPKKAEKLLVYANKLEKNIPVKLK